MMILTCLVMQRGDLPDLTVALKIDKSNERDDGDVDDHEHDSDDTDVLGYAKGRSARPKCGFED